MKKLSFLCLCLLLLLCAQAAHADTLTIDLDAADYDEVVSAIGTLKALRLQMLREKYADSQTITAADGISFRGIPWGAARSEAEKIVGLANSVRRSHILNTKAQAYTNGMGIDDQYSDWTAAGYAVTYCDLYYVYPVLDGMLIRDDALARFYMGQYDIRSLGDINAALADISGKLVKLYGGYSIANNGDFIWTDDLGNTLILHTWSSSFSLT